jgi:iron complex transport system substrate-binding protein
LEIEALATEVVDLGYQIHRELGPGLLESAYELVLASALDQRGLGVERQRRVDINFRGLIIRDAFRADLIVDGRLVVEIKSVEKLAGVHAKQLLTYLRLLDQPLGLLINFGAELYRDGVRRVVNGPSSFVRTRPR